MAKAKKLPSGNWRVNQYVGKDDNGKRIYKSFTASTKKEAEYMATAYVLNYKREEVALKTNQVEQMTVREAMQEYIRIKENILAPSTIYGYEVSMKNRFLDIQSILLFNLTNARIQESINKDALKVSPKTIANASGFLSAVLGQFRPDFRYKITLPAKEPKIKELIEPQVIFNLVKGSDIELPVLLAMWLSYRMSEVRGIKRSHIRDGYITIKETKVYVANQDFVRSKAKTEKSIRKSKVPSYIVSLIDKLPPEQEYLVTMKPYTITKHFYKLLDEAGLPHMTFHDLRHINASVMVMLGVQEKYAMERGGWSTPHVLQSVYQHTFSKERQAVDQKIDDYFENLMQHEMQHTQN